MFLLATEIHFHAREKLVIICYHLLQMFTIFQTRSSFLQNNLASFDILESSENMDANFILGAKLIEF